MLHPGAEHGAGGRNLEPVGAGLFGLRVLNQEAGAVFVLPGQIPLHDPFHVGEAQLQHPVEKARLAGGEVQLPQTRIDGREGHLPLFGPTEETLEHVPLTATVTGHEPERLFDFPPSVGGDGRPPGIVPHPVGSPHQQVHCPLPVAPRHGHADQVGIPLGAVTLIAEPVGHPPLRQDI